MDNLNEYPVKVTFPLVWGEMDAFGHLNNIFFFRYFESARIRYFEEAGLFGYMMETGIGPILAETSCKFKRPIQYPDQVTIGARTASYDEFTLNMEYIVVSEKSGRAALGTGAVVSFDYKNGKKVPVPEAVISAIEKLEGRKL